MLHILFAYYVTLVRTPSPLFYVSVNIEQNREFAIEFGSNFLVHFWLQGNFRFTTLHSPAVLLRLRYYVGRCRYWWRGYVWVRWPR